ncbi:hypothetical protein A4G19_08705 [Pasteurellaceae bacterium Macca]|nr:hypothetical protein [Pasteurellaceae bacterium Macca]
MPISIGCLFNRFFAISLLFLLIQQLIVASSTYWISELARNVALGDAFFYNLVCFIASLFVVYIPAFFRKQLLMQIKP